LGLKKYAGGKERDYSRSRAINALENAISIAPQETRHRINLALCYVEAPTTDNPMKGVLMLRDMLDKHPDDVGVLVQLGRLAIRTGQFDKALERLGKAYEIEPKNPAVLTYLVQAHQGKGEMEKAREYETLLKQATQ
jgi:cytochrome c-type biogenesis protein CcmH/NrfG